MPPMNVLLIGGHGKIALHMTKLLTAHSHTVTSVIRDQSQSSEISSISKNAHPVVESIEDMVESRLKELMKDKDTVIWAAGAGGKGGAERTEKVDFHAACRTILVTMNTPSVKKFLTISASVARDKDDIPSYWGDSDKETYQKAWDAIGTYCEMKVKADRYLTNSLYHKRQDKLREDLLAIVLRPGTLSDEPGTGKVDLGKAKINGSIPRQDVAEVAVKLLEGPVPLGDIMTKRHGVWWLDLLSGQESVDDAVKRVAEQGITSQERTAPENVQ